MPSVPDFVYHFMPLQRGEKDLDYVKAAVLNSKYFFGDPLKFNDPFDCKPNLFTSNYLSHIKQVEAVDNCLKQVGILCLAGELYNTLLWSHYTNGHKGVALQFNTNQIREAIQGIGICDNVEYHHELPTLEHKQKYDIKEIRSILFRKSRKWKYEKEFRVVLSLKNKNIRVQILREMPVRNIYLGCNICDRDKHALISCINNKTNSIYQMERRNDRYAYKRVKIR